MNDERVRNRHSAAISISGPVLEGQRISYGPGEQVKGGGRASYFTHRFPPNDNAVE